MNKIRIIPCLDVINGRLVKGINFKDLKDIGCPVEAAKFYRDTGADEIVFLDIGATIEERGLLLNLIKNAVNAIDIPLIVGGGIKTLEDIQEILDIGAEKVSINSAAISNPQIIKEASSKFGSEKIIVAIDAKRQQCKERWEVYTSGGTYNTGIDVLTWAKKIEKLGAGELLLTSMDKDGTKNGYDIKLTKAVTDIVDIPVIASGGAGRYEDFYDVIVKAEASGVLAASLFHYREIEIEKLKTYLSRRGLPVINKGDIDENKKTRTKF